MCVFFFFLILSLLNEQKSHFRKAEWILTALPFHIIESKIIIAYNFLR